MYSLKIRSSSLFILLLATSYSSHAEDWQFEFEPYGLISTIEGDAGIGRVIGAPVNVDFDTILENLDAAAMLHFEAHHKSGWGLSLDYGFMDLGADITLGTGGVFDVSVHQGVLEALVVNRTQTSDSTLDYTFGIRWWDNDLDLRFNPVIFPGSTSASVKEDWIDLVVGVRYRQNLNTDWDFAIQADVGGLGSDFTSSVASGFYYQMNQNWTLDLRYKATWVDYEDGNPGDPGFFAYDTVTHGPLIGFNYSY